MLVADKATVSLVSSEIKLPVEDNATVSLVSSEIKPLGEENATVSLVSSEIKMPDKSAESESSNTNITEE